MFRKLHKGWALYALGSAAICDAAYSVAGKPPALFLAGLFLILAAIVWAGSRPAEEEPDDGRPEYWF